MCAEAFSCLARVCRKFAQYCLCFTVKASNTETPCQAGTPMLCSLLSGSNNTARGRTGTANITSAGDRPFDRCSHTQQTGVWLPCCRYCRIVAAEVLGRLSMEWSNREHIQQAGAVIPLLHLLRLKHSPGVPHLALLPSSLQCPERPCPCAVFRLSTNVYRICLHLACLCSLVWQGYMPFSVALVHMMGLPVVIVGQLAPWLACGCLG